MKKINVITRHAIINYGSVLQAYATQKIFQQLGYDTTIIDYRSEHDTIHRHLMGYAKKRYANPIKRIMYYLAKFPVEWRAERCFLKYQKELLQMSSRFASYDALCRHDFGEEYLCAGSDQIWGYIYRDENGNPCLDPAYFLKFGSERNKRFSFSASFGRVDFKEEDFAAIRAYLKPFSFLSLREQSGVELIEKHTPYKAVHVLDPTLTVEPKVWYDLASCPKRKEKYIILYMLHYNETLLHYAQTLASQQGMKLIRITTSAYAQGKVDEKCVLQPPKEVLSLLRHAEFVVTDSFHCTVFSLIYNKQFVDFLPPVTYQRILDITTLLELQTRIVGDVSEESLAVATTPIDYEYVNGRLQEHREATIQLLAEALKGMQTDEN